MASTTSPASTPAAATPRRFPGLLKIAGFFALLTALTFAADWIVSAGLKRITTSKFGSLNRIMAGKVNADIIVNGSSRALFHYDPRVITAITGRSAYNIGMVAARTNIQLAVLKSYLKNNAPPKLILQNLESFSLVTAKSGEIYDPTAFQPYLRREDDLYEAFRRISPEAWKWRHIPMYGYAVEDLKFTWALGLLAWAGYSGPEIYHQGFYPRYDQWTDDFDKFRASAIHGLNYEIDPAGVAALTEIIELCRARGIDLILVYSPEFYEAQVLLQNRKEIFAVFRQLSEKYQVPLWDYSDSPLSRQISLFYSSQHMNANGAEAFTTDLARRLRDRRP